MPSSNPLTAYCPFYVKNIIFNFQRQKVFPIWRFYMDKVKVEEKNLVIAKHPSQKRTGSARPFGLPELPKKHEIKKAFKVIRKFFFKP